jgi:hypothetical protein
MALQTIMTKLIRRVTWIRCAVEIGLMTAEAIR